MTSIAFSRPAGLPFLRLPYVVAFAAAALAAGLGRAVTTSYLPLMLERINDAPGLIGMVMLVNAAAGMAVPLVVGIWSDRLARSGRGRRMPFILGGALVTAGGLVAIALGSSSSYLVLALSAAVVYVGLNAVTTAHRALIPEAFDASGRPKATSAQELAMLVGGLLGLAVGGALTGLAIWAPFALTAVLVPLLALPTIRRVTEPEGHSPMTTAAPGNPTSYYLRAALRPGVRGFLLAQILWVLGYAALPAFFLLYAEDELGLGPSVASLWLAGFGLATGMGIVLAGRVKNPALHRPLLLVGIALLGGGFLGVGASTSLVPVGGALILGAAGFGLVSTLGFPLFSSLIPEREAGAYTALYFSVRAISSTIALPVAGLTVQATGSYRSLFLLGGIATLTALVPLVGVRRPRSRSRFRTALGLLAVVPVLGVLVAHTDVHRADEWLYRAINGLGPGPDLLWKALDPHTRNYLLLIALAVVAGAVSNVRGVPRVFARVFGSAVLAWGLLEAVYAVYDRARPEEVVEHAILNGHSWAHLNSFPSGHMAITAALSVSVALAFPRLRFVLWAYIAAVAFTRVMFGAHFPLDTVAGTALGTASALLVAIAFDRRRRQTTDLARRAARRGAHARRSDAVAQRRPRARARSHGARARRLARDRRRRLAARRGRAARRARGSVRRAARPAAGAKRQGLGGSRGHRPCSRRRRRARDRRRRAASARGDPVVRPRRRQRRARDRRPLRRPRRDAPATPAREPRDPKAVRARDRSRGARHAERHAPAQRTRARAAALGRLRGGDLAPPPRPPRRRARRVGRYPGDLRRRAKLVPARAGLGESAVGAGATARTSHTDARPRATPSAVPASTSLA